MNHKISGVFLGLSLALSQNNAFADFTIRCEEDRPAERYGNAQTGTFQRALTGERCMTDRDAAEIAAILPARDYQRYYVRFRFNQSMLRMGSVQNRSRGLERGGVVVNGSASKSQPGLEFALGYIWSPNMRGDIEYLTNRNLIYTSNPILIGTGITPRNMTSTIKNNVILLNGYYDFVGLGRLRPYLTAGVGPSVTSVQSTVTPAPAGQSGNRTVQSFRAAYALGVGTRLGFFSQFFLDISYRYIQLGNMVRMQPTNNIQVNGTYGASVLSAGFIFLF